MTDDAQTNIVTQFNKLKLSINFVQSHEGSRILWWTGRSFDRIVSISQTEPYTACSVGILRRLQAVFKICLHISFGHTLSSLECLTNLIAELL